MAKVSRPVVLPTPKAPLRRAAEDSRLTRNMLRAYILIGLALDAGERPEFAELDACLGCPKGTTAHALHRLVQTGYLVIASHGKRRGHATPHLYGLPKAMTTLPAPKLRPSVIARLRELRERVG